MTKINGMRALIVTPLLPPAPGGGGIYTELLAKGLTEGGWCKKVVIATEAFPGQPSRSMSRSGDIDVRRIYPYRAGASRKTIGSYWRYLIQNFQLLGLPRLIRREAIDVVLFHASFLYNPGISAQMVRWAASSSKVRWVADVRDPCLPVERFSVLYPFHALIACSENVLQHLSADKRLAAKVHLVPIPASVTPPSLDLRASVLARFRLKARSYVLSLGGVVSAKGVDDAIAAVRRARRTDPSVFLVVVGKDRDRNTRHTEAEREGILKYLGILDHETCLALAVDSIVVLNLSRADGMPRASLEPLLAGAPILVAPGIPEFERCCPDAVVEPADHDEVARRILELRANRIVPRYDTANHDVTFVAKETAKVLAGIESGAPMENSPQI